MTQLDNMIKDWRNLKNITRNISQAKHPELREQYTRDLYQGVRDYWSKYHVKFDFSRQPREVKE